MLKQKKVILNKRKLKFLIIITVVCILMISLVVIFYYRAPLVKVVKNKEAYMQSVIANDPKDLQDLFAKDIVNGVNDKGTRASAYFIVHRYFDNNGNIYEIYDYVNSHPELAFLKEAETMYPKVFQFIKERKLPKTGTDSALYAVLAYLEILDKHGYADVADHATLMNQYAKFAYFNTRLKKEFHPNDLEWRKLLIERDTTKALFYREKTKGEVNKISKDQLNTKDIEPRNVLVGLNQYAAGLRYLELIGIPRDTNFLSADYTFLYSLNYSSKYVPELYTFTSYLNASTYSLFSSSTDQLVVEALNPFFAYIDLKKKNKLPYDKGSLFLKIINAKNEEIVIPEDISFDIFGKTNVVSLAKRDPRLKQLLIEKGWTENDFSTGPIVVKQKT